QVGEEVKGPFDKEPWKLYRVELPG
ncbi:MAG: hypothetical protein JWP03_3449, partial [Phycisphaerales bacterium]|nr:hypothetical protein [Phycisphaerales bacterium]